MDRQQNSTHNPGSIIERFNRVWVLAIFIVLLPYVASADPIGNNRSFAGNYNFVVTGGTLRTSSSDACAVTTGIRTAPLSGVPTNPSTTIRAAYLYWAGSGSNPDLRIRFEGQNLNSDRSFTESVGGSRPRDWFGGFKDVTTIVRNKAGGPNGTYSFGRLRVDSGGNHCAVATVLSGWGLVVIYEDPAVEPLRVINLYDGLQNFWGGSISLNPSNFRIPNSGIDGKFGVLTWEGDQGNSGTRNSLNEELRFNGTTLIDGLNPIRNQYNSTINDNSGSIYYSATNVHGVDFDVHDVSGTLSAGDTSATTFYSSGQDRVLLMLEIISVTNSPVADLAINKSHIGDFIVGQQGAYTLQVSNSGPSDATGVTTVTDTLPAGLTYVSGVGANWTCSAVGQAVTCTYNHPVTQPFAMGTSLPDITLTVDVHASAAPSVTNTASVSNPTFDNQLGDNSSSDTANVLPGPDISITKTVSTLSNPIEGDINAKAIPGAIMQYRVVVTNRGAGPADLDSVVITDPFPAYLRLVLKDPSAPATDPLAPVTFIDGNSYGQSASGLTFTGPDTSSLNDVALSNDGGATFLPLGSISESGGVDSTVPKINFIRINPKGVLAGAAGGSDPSFTLEFQLVIE